MDGRKGFARKNALEVTVLQTPDEKWDEDFVCMISVVVSAFCCPQRVLSLLS